MNDYEARFGGIGRLFGTAGLEKIVARTSASWAWAASAHGLSRRSREPAWVN
jgi:hypothetical protein